MFEDFRQSLPVKNAALNTNEFFIDDAWKGLITFQSFENVTELSVKYRQNTDIDYTQLLECAAYGYITDDDYITLPTRRCNISDKEEQDRFNDAINVYP